MESNGLTKTFTSIADEIGIAESTVRKNIVSIFIGRLKKKFRFEPPVILGIDEVHLNRQMRLVLTNIGENTIVDLVSSRKKQSVIKALYRFKQLKQIVTILRSLSFRAKLGILRHPKLQCLKDFS